MPSKLVIVYVDPQLSAMTIFLGLRGAERTKKTKVRNVMGLIIDTYYIILGIVGSMG